MASSSTSERQRSISGSSVGLDEDAQQQQQQQPHHHHQHHHQHHHHNHSSQQQHHQHHPPQHSHAMSHDYATTLGHMHLFQNFASSVGDANHSSSSAMNLSQISAESSASITAASRTAGLSITHNIGGSYCRFPKLEECAHFHYERVQLGQILLRLIEDRLDAQSGSNVSQHHLDAGAAGAAVQSASATTSASAAPNTWFIIRVTAEKSDPFLIRRSLDNIRMLDEMLHRCVYDRKISGLRDFQLLDATAVESLQLENLVAAYLNRFSNIMSDSLTCGPVLTWFQLDNKGRRLPLADMDTMKSINTPAVGAAYGIRKYTAQAVDEISIEVGDMISVIDMPSPAESTWWRGKKSHLEKSHYEVGFFPQSCVATIGDKVPRNLVLPAPLVGSLAVSPTKPVLRKHGKLIAFFRSFILSRPSRRRLKQSGIYKERVFSCDLSEHLLNSGQEIPMVLRCCAEFIEESGIVDGIYRLSGITSNIQKLRRSFDEERIPDFSLPDVRQDIHAMSSLLKMYFRELPNPLCTFQLYDHFVDAIQTQGDAAERLRLMKETVQKLPPPHYRTLKYLAKHLNKISHHHKSTGMTDRNLAIVWAPNLLRSPALETGDDYISGVAALRGVGVQAVVTEYLITNCALIFDSAEEYDRYESLQYDSLTDTESLQLEQRDHHDHSLFIERPKSLSVGGPKLISLEEAQTRRSGDSTAAAAVSKAMTIAATPATAANAAGSGGAGLGASGAILISASSGISSYIEVGGGPSSLPDKYHTVLPVPRSWSKRKTHSWKSLFTRNQQRSSAADLKPAAKKTLTISHPCQLTVADGGAVARGGTAGAALAMESGGSGQGTLLMAQQTASASSASSAAATQHISLRNGHEQMMAAKSIDVFEDGISCGGAGSAGKTPLMDLCLMRSASIDSLRTVGHSRSVSHDSYFDLLQSPLRSGAAGTCGMPTGAGAGAAAETSGATTRELSELGLNFDREEPEMRIFSESESLVSSPRPAGNEMARRSATRSRPDDPHSGPSAGHGQHGNNPSPKKQPRLNIPVSGVPAASNLTGDLQWCSASSGSVTPSVGAAPPAQHDESMCKRYKLEDQLSDIQFIDCSTPEHCAAAAAASAQQANATQPYNVHVQVHSAPHDSRADSASLADPVAFQSAANGAAASASAGAVRYSYPGNKTRNFSPDAQLLREERFSYPGMGRKFTLTDAAAAGNGGGSISPTKSATPHRATDTFPPAVNAAPMRASSAKHPGRFSYCDPAQAAALANAHANHASAGTTAAVAVAAAGDSASLARSNSADLNAPHRSSKLSLPTPSTPGQSPRYSLLVGDTSSECSSAIGTPVGDATMDVSQCGALLAPQHDSANSTNVSPAASPARRPDQARAAAADPMSTSCPSPVRSAPRDLAQMKRELSLDLGANTTATGLAKMEHMSSVALREQQQKQQQQPQPQQQPQQQHVRSTPETPNQCTTTTETSGGGNTSQSVTPSEFGYHHLSASRQSNAVSPAISLSSPTNANAGDAYETMERSFGSAALKSVPKQQQPQQQPLLASPIRSTINITYNLRSPATITNTQTASTATPTHENVFFGSQPSPAKHRADATDVSADYELVTVVTVEAPPTVSEAAAAAAAAEAKKPLLETSFDENMVYEQVKFFKGAVSEINSMLMNVGENGNAPVDASMDAESSDCSSVLVQLQQQQSLVANSADIDADASTVSYVSESLQPSHNSEESTDADVPMHDQELDDIQDSLELDPNVSLYENVELRRPDNVYENVAANASATTASAPVASLRRKQGASANGVSMLPPLARPSTFNVRQLANKFESTTPTADDIPAQAVPFEFTKPGSVRRLDSNRNSSFAGAVSKPPQHSGDRSAATKATHHLHGAASRQHTRSLDENAFVREFGAQRGGGGAAEVAKSIQMIANAAVTTRTATAGVLADAIDGRRMSLEFTRPKTLNPPKRLPELDGAGCEALEQPLCKAEALKLKLDGQQRAKFERITPTTENPISLIQHNVSSSNNERDSLEPKSLLVSEDERSLASLPTVNPTSGGGVKVQLGSCKLDRERIEKIKEERRLQLNEKFRGGAADATAAGADGSAAASPTGSAKSKSKSRIELRDLKDDAVTAGVELRYKSKSRGDVRTTSSMLRDSRESLNQLMAGGPQRVRRISDEKNQNDCTAFAAPAAAATAAVMPTDSAANSVSNKARKFDGPTRQTAGAAAGLTLGLTATTNTISVPTSNVPIGGGGSGNTRLSLGAQRERISPQFNIRDVAAMFESRSQQ